MVGIGLLIAAGVSITAATITFIAGELSDKERAIQAEIDQKLKNYNAKMQSDLQHYALNAEARTNRELDNINLKARRQANLISKQHVAQVTEERLEILKIFKEKALILEQINSERIDEFQKIRKTLEQQKKNNTNTLLRATSLQKMIDEFFSFESKAKAYSEYLKVYINKVDRIITEEKEWKTIDFCSLQLPENFLYPGKLLYLTKAQLTSENQLIVDNAAVFTRNYCFSEFDKIEMYADTAEIPVVCERYDREKRALPLSVVKGQFKHSVMNALYAGIEVQVKSKKAQQQAWIVTYENTLEMTLRLDKLEDSTKPPYIGATITVYPYKIPNNYENIEVSQKLSDCIGLYNFDEVPVLIDKNNYGEFYQYLNEHKLLEEVPEFKFAPYDEAILPEIQQIKAQMGTHTVILFDVKIPNPDLNEHFPPHLKYVSMLDYDTYALKPEDIYVSVGCSLVFAGTEEFYLHGEKHHKNMGDLFITLETEFKLQQQIKMSMPGMQYFNKWSEVTSKLITYLQKGKSITVEIEKITDNGYYRNQHRIYFVYERGNNKVARYTESIYENTDFKSNVMFFIEVPPFGYIPIRFSNCDEYFTVNLTNDQIGVIDQLKELDEITIYNKEFAYAEIQQLKALKSFNMGKLANPDLQVYALDSSKIEAVHKNVEITQFFNQYLPTDPSQKQAVENIVNEKNIFFVQGPPGTGKTTVIREIIEQAIVGDEYRRILMVSQANVAVDNVLKKFKNDSNQFIRCGSKVKIDKDIENMAFEVKYKDYVEKIRNKEITNTKNRHLLEQWKEIIGDSTGSNPNADIGQLIMRKHTIIGATCVGLAKKKIGLEKIDFDLVIIDEAGKALPAEILLPYLKAKKVLLIGDHKQLPPVINPALYDDEKIEMTDRDVHADSMFDTSFFEKVYTNVPNGNKAMLTTQYRMPPTIGAMISNLFYDGELRNGKSTYGDDKKPLFFKANLNLLDMQYHKKYCEDDSESVINIEETKVVVEVVKQIRKKLSAAEARIAIITPYRGQKRELKNALENSRISLERIDVDTVDAFQGDEAEIVIFCTTRAKKQTKYFSDVRRINVALSRATNDLLVIGSSRYFLSYDEMAVLPRVLEEIHLAGHTIHWERWKQYSDNIVGAIN